MDKSLLKEIAVALNGILLDLMIDGKLNAPATTVRILRQVADKIEASNPYRT